MPQTICQLSALKSYRLYAVFSWDSPPLVKLATAGLDHRDASRTRQVELFDCNALGQIARLVDVSPFGDRGVIG